MASDTRGRSRLDGLMRNEPRPPLTVADVMTPDPILLSADDGLDAAAQMLEESEISGAPVVDSSGQLVGVLSETDLVHARATQLLWTHWSELQVRHLMHSPAITADPGMGIAEAAELMEEARVHRLVIVGDDQLPIGVLSTGDVIRAVLGERSNG